MADNITTPVADGSVLAAKDIAGVKFPQNLLADTTGIDAMGVVGANPGANTLLGRLKDIVTAVTTMDGHVDGVEALLTTLNTLVDGLESGQAAGNASLVTIAGYLDTVETLLGAAATSAKQDLALPTGPAFPITPHATNPLERVINGLAIISGGTVIYRHPAEGADRTVTLPAGLFPLRASHIRTGGTATGLTGF